MTAFTRDRDGFNAGKSIAWLKSGELGSEHGGFLTEDGYLYHVKGSEEQVTRLLNPVPLERLPLNPTLHFATGSWTWSKISQYGAVTGHRDQMSQHGAVTGHCDQISQSRYGTMTINRDQMLELPYCDENDDPSAHGWPVPSLDMPPTPIPSLLHPPEDPLMTFLVPHTHRYG